MLVDDNLKVMSQHKRYSFSPDTKLDLEVAQKVAIIDVEELAPFGDHDVIRVTVSYTQYVCHNTVTSTGATEPLSSFL